MYNKYIKFPPSLKLWRTSRRTSIFSGLLLIIFLNLLVQAQFCQAVSTQTDLKDQMRNAASPGWGAGDPTAETSLTGIVKIAVSAFLGLLGIIFLVLIIYAGFNWMTAQGDEEKVKLAKDTLTRAIIGLIIILAAYSITYFVFSSLSGGGGSGPLDRSGKNK